MVSLTVDLAMCTSLSQPTVLEDEKSYLRYEECCRGVLRKSAVRFVSADHTQEPEVVIANGKNERG